MSKKPVVYVVNEPLRFDPAEGRLGRAIDLTPALEYGDLVFLTPPGNPPLDPTGTLSDIQRMMQDFRARDYILPVGHPILIGWTCALAAQKTGGRINMLKWEQRTRRYTGITAQLWSEDDPPELTNDD